ncbi:hypothetical protein [Rhizobium sp. S163]|uniref:BRO-N domain-containing protein n=1 Tax=Rhizobium sp. S163 TaxID=3055039 RepID=UPI0025A955EF|nr:hypothetical protein [Rhizobium sp. S163]MDM9644523.1 hypothetical protein [Rhizobium sp. S163]
MHNEPSANSGHGTPMPLNNVQTLTYRSTSIRFALIAGQPWFVAADVCKAVGVYNYRHGAANNVRALAPTHKALARLSDVPRGSPNVLIVSETGLDKLLWLALHSVTESWLALSDIKAHVATIVANVAKEAA